MALLEAASDKVNKIFLLAGRKDPRAEAVVALAEKQCISLVFYSRSELDALFDAKVQHQGVVIQYDSPSALNESFLAEIVAQATEPLLLLILDGVQDPHNLGACLRSANGFGVDAVIVPKDRACNLTPTVSKVACGAINITPLITVTNLSRSLNYLQSQGLWLVGMAGQAETLLSEIDLSGHIGIVMGSEGQGMRKMTQKNCDYTAKIPMKGSVESFNVSVAASLALYEAVRQRA